MKKILVTATNYSKYCSNAKKYFEDHSCLVVENPHNRPFTFDELKELVGDVDGVVAGVDDWNEEVFKIAPRLKAIARFGVGVDNIDISKAKEYGITVTNCAGVNANAVAEHAVGLMLAMIRQIPGLNSSTRAGKWERLMFHEVRGKSIGLMGFGAIARSFAEKLKGFGVNITAWDKYPDMAKAQELGVDMVSLDKLITGSDIISIHLPALPEIKQLINADLIYGMKDGVYMINTARGILVDEDAIYDALKSGKIAGYAADVFGTEPAQPSNRLFELDNYICTPHVSAETYENCEACGLVTAKAIIDVFNGRVPQNCLNE